jgi:hypothetical protein
VRNARLGPINQRNGKPVVYRVVDFVIELTKKLQHQRQLVNVSNLEKKGIDSFFRGVFSFFMTASFHLHYHIISLRGEIWAHKTSLTSRHHLLLKYLCPVKPGK